MIQQKTPRCFYHPQQYIQNFCVVPQCCLPLCPKCIQVHIREHQSKGINSDIESYSQTVQRICTQIQENVKVLAAQGKSLEDYHPSRTIAPYLQILQKSNKLVIEMVNNAFQRCKNKLTDILNTKYQYFISSSEYGAHLDDVVSRQIVALKELGQGVKCSLKPIIQYMGEQKNAQTSALFQLIQSRKNEFRNNLPSLQIHQRQLQSACNSAIELVQMENLARRNTPVLSHVNTSRVVQPVHSRENYIGQLETQLQVLRQAR